MRTIGLARRLSDGANVEVKECRRPEMVSTRRIGAKVWNSWAKAEFLRLHEMIEEGDATDAVRPGPKPERLAIDMPFEQAVQAMFAAGKPERLAPNIAPQPKPNLDDHA